MSAKRSNDGWTIGRVLQWTTAYLQRRGSDSPRLDAEILLAHARRCRRIELYTQYNVPLTASERQTMRGLVERRAASEPVAYLVGHREFFSLDFRVTPEVLIPRPETETLVVELLELCRPLVEVRILDVGTGSGCIAVAVAVNKPGARLVATDLSGAAVELARANAERHAVADRIEFLQGDLFEPLQESGRSEAAGGRFDFIVSNPPYIADSEWETLQPDVRLHEPRLALVAGSDGLDVIRRLIAEAPQFLLPGGRLLFEIDPAQADPVCTLLEAAGDYDEVRIVNDVSRQPRVALARRS